MGVQLVPAVLAYSECSGECDEGSQLPNSFGGQSCAPGFQAVP